MPPPRAAIVFAALALSVAPPALAQTTGLAQSRSLAPSGGAAATLPNTFDAPAAPPAGMIPPAAPRGQVTEAQMAEAALRTVITQMQAGEIDLALFTPDLGRQFQSRMTTFAPLVEGFGELVTIEAQGATADGGGQFLVTFDKAATQWLIGLEDGGLIAALLFRPAPTVPAATPAASDR